MINCGTCGSSVPEGATFCPVCGATQKTEGTNPYQVSDAVIDAAPLVPVGRDEEGYEYNVQFGVSATISETFNAWFNSLGQLVLISLIPLIPGIVLTLVSIGVLVSLAMKKFPSLLENFEIDRLAELFGGIGVGMILVFVGFILIVMVTSLPAFMGQFKIMDEKMKHGVSQSSIWYTYMAGFKFVLPIFGFGFLLYIAMGVFILPVGLVGGSAAFSVLYVVAIMVVMSFLAARFCIFLPLMVLEGLPLFSALARSNKMVTGRTWKVMGIYGVFFAIMIAIGSGLGILGLIPILGQLVGVAAQLLLAPLQAALMFSIYAGLKSPTASFY